MIFELILQDDNHVTRKAILDTFNSKLTWQDNNQNLISFSEKYKSNSVEIYPTQKNSPAAKSTILNTIKIQLGFACNFTCNYCSQNPLRDSNKESINNQLDKVHHFISNLPEFFGAGANGDGTDVAIEFWGGETLIYWESVKKLSLFFKNKFPQIKLGLFTNGSLINKEIADFAAEHHLHIIISHDGPTFVQDRSKDPLETSIVKDHIKYLFHKLRPLNLISFNATVSIKNYSLIEIAKHIAERLEVPISEIELHYELATPYDSNTIKYTVNENQRNEYLVKIFNEYLKQYPFNLKAGNIDRELNTFYEMFSMNHSLKSVYQKCNMDSPHSIAVDLDGNVLTCQNVTANSGHKIGELKNFENVKLTTSTHFLNREACQKCPVVNICKGSCMFLENELWEAACEQHFTWSLAFLAFALKIETGLNLIQINGENLRNLGDKTVKVIS